MKVKVDFDLCEANAVCMDVAPELFMVDDDDSFHHVSAGAKDDVGYIRRSFAPQTAGNGGGVDELELEAAG